LKDLAHELPVVHGQILKLFEIQRCVSLSLHAPILSRPMARGESEK
jgi:hypothetical protein